MSGNGGRARGKHQARIADGNPDADYLKSKVDPDSPEGHKLGLSKRVQGAPSPIPGGRNHILNAQVFRQTPEAPNPADFTDQPYQNAHGVAPTSHNGATRAQLVRGKRAEEMPDTYYTDVERPVRPIPVYVVEEQTQNQVYRAATAKQMKAPAGADPAPICGRDPERIQVLLLNEDTNAVRIAQTVADLGSNGGAILPASMTSYLRLPSQDHLYAYSPVGSAITLSVIQIFEHHGSGL